MLSYLQFFLDGFLVCIGLYLAFFKSYFQEKGKNVATKEDIEEITKKIEKVKSDIGILTHKKISLSTEKQSSLLDFSEKYTAWVGYIIHASLIPDTEHANTFIVKTREKLEQFYYDFIIAETKINIFFISDTELIQLIDEIRLKTILLSNHFQETLILLGSETEKVKIAFNIPDHPPDNSYKLKKIEEQYAEQNAKHIACQEKKLEKYKMIIPLYLQLTKIISQKVYDLEVE